MKLTDNLKVWLREKKSVADDADDATYRKAAAEAICDDTLDDTTLKELTKDPDAEKANVVVKTMASMQEAMAAMAAQMAALAQKPVESKARPTSNVTPSLIATGQPVSNDETKVNVVTMDKMYSTARQNKYFPQQLGRGPHPFAGQRMFEASEDGGTRTIDFPSDLDRAVKGAFAKVMVFGPLIAQGHAPKHYITDHDRDLVKYALHNMEWCGQLQLPDHPDPRPVNCRKLTPYEIKDVLPVWDELAASRGHEIVPIVFDDDIITKPLWSGDFYPRCNVKTIARGRLMEGAMIDNVAFTSNATGQEQTAITLDDTLNFITAFDTTIYTIQGGIEVGLDLLADTPINFGDYLTDEFGKRLAFELDRQIVAGNGAQEMTGIRDQGTVTAFGNEWTAEDILTLRFNVSRAYVMNTDMNRLCFGGQESTYADIRGIKTGVTGDTRLLFNMDVNQYTLFDHPFLTNAAYATTELNFVNLSRYRIYRRLGMTIASTTEGRALMTANKWMLIARARFGGQLEDTNACAYTVTGA